MVTNGKEQEQAGKSGKCRAGKTSLSEKEQKRLGKSGRSRYNRKIEGRVRKIEYGKVFVRPGKNEISVVTMSKSC